jgi:hypothetical protein
LRRRPSRTPRPGLPPSFRGITGWYRPKCKTAATTVQPSRRSPTKRYRLGRIIAPDQISRTFKLCSCAQGSHDSHTNALPCPTGLRGSSATFQFERSMETRNRPPRPRH